MERQNRRLKVIPDDSPAWEPQDDEERGLEEMFRDGTIAKLLSDDPKVVAARKRCLKKLYTAKPKRSPKVPVTMRMEGITLAVLKDQARTQGLPYQTLISSVLFKYITGQLVERKK